MKEKLIFLYYFFLGGSWHKLENPKNGYSVILPVLPEFYGITEYNLRFMTSCDLADCNEIIVVSDSPKYYNENLNAVNRYSNIVNIKYIVISNFKRLLIKFHKTSHVIHAANLITGINHSKSKYIFIHDMDFFITEKNHMKKIFDQITREQLNLISSYSRTYPTGKAPATYELLLSRQFITSRPPYFLFGCNINGKWYSTLTRFYIEAKTGREKLMDSDIGIHFKHLFDRYRAFEKQKTSFVDLKYSIFMLFVLSKANPCVKHNLLETLDEYFNMVKIEKMPYLEKLEKYFLLMTGSPLISKKEREFMMSCFKSLKDRLS
ncbi:transferase-domain-containing protein [Desulfonema limicola]|uniref:Transferase-domain-containing protein n=1 Tax=Desulfonema limicola TaxID=45656 RepID=A0A975B5H6_9BACT|nr:hypothetical protein [Desulfonema limicola]QTA79119.1 transferase-domain-containing protein [Desulfonema limicola]